MKPDLSDLLAMVGLLLLGYGLYLISLPLMLIVIGALLLVLGLWGALQRGRERQETDEK